VALVQRDRLDLGRGLEIPQGLPALLRQRHMTVRSAAAAARDLRRHLRASGSQPRDLTVGVRARYHRRQSGAGRRYRHGSRPVGQPARGAMQTSRRPYRRLPPWPAEASRREPPISRGVTKPVRRARPGPSWVHGPRTCRTAVAAVENLALMRSRTSGACAWVLRLHSHWPPDRANAWSLVESEKRHGKLCDSAGVPIFRFLTDGRR
jgi:hypothetical protein